MKLRTLVYRIRHLSRRRRNRVLAAIALINGLLLFLIYSNLFVYPNTYLGKTDVSAMTAGQIKKLLDREQSVVPKIQIKDRTYQYGYDQMGIVIDRDRAIDALFKPNRAFFPISLVYFIRQVFSQRTVAPPLVFTQQFEQFIGDMIFDFGQSADNISVDPTTKSLVVEENAQVYRMDSASLKELLLAHFGQYSHPIYPMLAKVTNETINQVVDINEKLAAVFSSPIIVYLDLDGTTVAIELKEEDIREATTVILDPDRVHVSVTVNSDALNRVIIRRVHAAGFPIRNTVVTQNVRDDFQKAVTLRFGGTNVAAVTTTLDGGPNTNGSIADKYIEVDISQAKMYLFENGKVYKSYKVSTGLDYPTPVGHFTILNKVGLGFSTIYNVWLPWWMGFSYSEELQAYFGIHEQPYTLTADGKPVTRGPNIGTPSTGGCVALAPGAAREVYAFADVGTPVYIFN